MPLVPQTSVAGRGCENDHAELALIKGEALIARAQWMHHGPAAYGAGGRRARHLPPVNFSLRSQLRFQINPQK